MSSPFNIDEQREAIDAHKERVMRNIYKQGAYAALTKERCIEFWIEQMGDAELYAERHGELDAADELELEGDA